MSALCEAFQANARDEPLVLGAIKTNIGHLEAASGIASLVKVILSLEKGSIPPNFNRQEPGNPLVEKFNVNIPKALIPWPIKSGAPKRASINSFGLGGTNSHVIVESVEDFLASFPTPSSAVSDSSLIKQSLERFYLFPISAASKVSGQAWVSQFRDYITNAGHDTPPLSDISYTLGARRSRLNNRSYVVAQSVEELALGCEQTSWKSVKGGETPRVAFIFTGQGGQW